MMFATTMRENSAGTVKITGIFDLDNLCEHINYNLFWRGEQSMGLFVSDGMVPFNACDIDKPHFTVFKPEDHRLEFRDSEGNLVAYITNFGAEMEAMIHVGNEETFGNPLTENGQIKYVLTCICDPTQFF